MISKNTLKYPFILIVTSLLIRLIFIGQYHLFVEEAYYWNYAQHLDFGYLDHPPMVALLIKLSTLLLGTHEFGVRIGAFFCWIITVYFAFQLSQTIRKGSGIYAVMLLSILPFFVLHSLVITPDLPLMAAWSASLYFLYHALILNRRHAWFYAGIAIGLGLVSKYSIALLGLAIVCYLCLIKDARIWFKRKEPYLAALLALLIFSPVIYWNATHDWASFAFQSTRRLHAHTRFSLHVLLGLFILFLTPIGVIGSTRLFKRDFQQKSGIDKPSIRFMQIFLLVPLAVFAYVSLTHTIKFNWIGPSLLAVIPWLSIWLTHAETWIQTSWKTTAGILFLAYIILFSCICLGPPKHELAPLLSKNIAWEAFSQSVNQVASQWEKKLARPIVIVPLDQYHTSSELAFYQEKLYQNKQIPTIFKTMGADLFGIDSLMYRYWTQEISTQDNLLMIITNNIKLFDNPSIAEKVSFKTPLLTIASHTQGQKLLVGQYYYRLAELRKP